MRQTLLLLLLFFCLFFPLQAEEKPIPHQNSIRIQLAVPPFEARISVGIFSPEGLLIRKLAELVPDSRLQVGLNGFEFSWDGKNDLGKEVPPGIYSIIGTAAGALQPELVRVEGNDWRAEFGNDLPIARILALSRVDQFRLALLAKLINEQYVVFVYDTFREELIWSRILPKFPTGRWILGRPSARWLGLLHQRSVLILDPANGQQLICGDLPPSTSSATSMFLLSDRLLLTGPWGVRHFSLIGLQEFPSHWNFSNPALLVFQKDNTVGALDENRNLWIKKSLDLEFQKQFEGWKFEDLSPSAEETFWAIGFSVAENYRQAVGEFSLREGFLRELSQVSMPGFPLQIEFNPDSKVLFLHFRSEEADSVILGIYKSPLDERWREFFRRRILLPDGKLPDGFEFLPRSLNFASEAGLEIASKVRNWRLVYRISGEVSLELESGLRVADLMRTEYADAVQAKMEEDTLLLRVLEPGATLIWKFSGLPQKIAWLDGGEVIWPPPAPPPGSN